MHACELLKQRILIQQCQTSSFQTTETYKASEITELRNSLHGITFLQKPISIKIYPEL